MIGGAPSRRVVGAYKATNTRLGQLRGLGDTAVRQMNGRASSSQGQGQGGSDGGVGNQQYQFQNPPSGYAVYQAARAFTASNWGARQQGARQGVASAAGSGTVASSPRIAGASPPIPSVGQFASPPFPGAGLPNGGAEAAAAGAGGGGARGQVEVFEVCVLCWFVFRSVGSARELRVVDSLYSRLISGVSRNPF